MNSLWLCVVHIAELLGLLAVRANCNDNVLRNELHCMPGQPDDSAGLGATVGCEVQHSVSGDPINNMFITWMQVRNT